MMDMRAEKRAGLSGPVRALRSKQNFEGARTGRRLADLLLVPRVHTGSGCQRTEKKILKS